MLSKKVIIRVDGNPNIGLGHIYRGLALAEMLKNKFVIEFVTRTDTTISPIQNSEFDYIFISEEIELYDEPNWFKENYSTDTLLVLDGYQFNEFYQQKIKELNYKLIYIDDLAKGKQKADLVINHSPGIKISDYKTEKYTKLALGLKYALLRKSYIEFDRTKVLSKNGINNIFISFGGSDINDFSFLVTKEVLSLDFVETINVVLGVAYKNKTIFDVNSSKLKIHKNLSEHEIFKLMKDTDLAIVPASTTSIELASLGIPMILGYFVDNQKGIYKGFNERGVVTGIGNFNDFNFENLNDTIESLDNSDKLNKQSLKLLSFFKSSIDKNIIKTFHFDNISIRNASESDIKFVFALSNESLVRSNSYNSNKIEFDQHKLWFQNQMKENLFYIVEFENQNIGQVRFNIKEDYALIGISISDKYRGKGLALKSLELSVKKYFKNNNSPIYAYIKKSNIPSIKIFENVGFSFYKEKLIEDIDSFIYIKEK